MQPQRLSTTAQTLPRMETMNIEGLKISGSQSDVAGMRGKKSEMMITPKRERSRSRSDATLEWHSVINKTTRKAIIDQKNNLIGTDSVQKMLEMVKDGTIDSHINAAAAAKMHQISIQKGTDEGEPVQPVPLTPSKQTHNNTKYKRLKKSWLDQRQAMYPKQLCCATNDITHPVYIKIGHLTALSTYQGAVIRRKLLQYYKVAPSHPHYDFYLPKGRDIHISLELLVNDATIFQLWIPIYRREHRQSHYLQNWIELPLNYSNLTMNTKLRMKLYRFFSTEQFVLIGESMLPFFNNKGFAYRGNHKLKFRYTHPALVDLNGQQSPKDDFVNDELINLQQLVVQHRTKSWMNDMSNVHIAKLESAYEEPLLLFYTLTLSLPQYPIPVLHADAFEEDYSMQEDAFKLSSYIVMQQMKSQSDSVTGLERLSLTDSSYHSILDETDHHFDVDNYYVDQLCLRDRMCTTDDPRTTQNPVAAMFRSFHKSVIDYTKLKPDVEDSKKLGEILHRSPLVEPMEETRQLLFYYRYYLLTDSRYLVPFLRSVDWTSREERDEAELLLSKWSKIDSYQALFLLTFHFAENTKIRQYAVSIIDESMNDDQLFDILLQLVQSLRYEKDMLNSSLAKMLLSRAKHSSLNIMTYLYWYLVVESEGKSKAAHDYHLLEKALLEMDAIESKEPNHTEINEALSPVIEEENNVTPISLDDGSSMSTSTSSSYDSDVDVVPEETSKKKPLNLLINSRSPEDGETINDLLAFTSLPSPALSSFAINMNVEHVLRQRGMMDLLDEMAIKLKNAKGDRIRKIGTLKKWLDVDSPFKWSDVFYGKAKSHILPHPTRLPLCPSLDIHSFDASKATIFKSAMNPILLPFMVSDEKTPLSPSAAPPGGNHKKPYLVIYKSGDDLRQDQLVNQIVRLMDNILCENGIHMELTPYKVLATGRQSGFVECVTPNQALSAVIKKGAIHSWLQKQSSNSSSYASACRRFILSCAGYSVITYILGIGDRHLDNILLSPDGRLFHIDFGYMLGRDPKPLPPPMKICSEMVVALKAMPSSDAASYANGYDEFISLCLTAFIVLRRYSSRFVTIFVLMRDASIPDIDHNARGYRLRNIKRFEDKFMLSLSDSQARQALRSIIQESEKAIAPKVTETIHRWAQYWRR